MDFIKLLLTVKFINNALHILSSLVLDFPKDKTEVTGGKFILYNPFFIISGEASSVNSRITGNNLNNWMGKLDIKIENPPEFSFNFNYPVVSTVNLSFEETISLLFNKKDLKYTIPDKNLPIIIKDIEVNKNGPVLYFWLEPNGISVESAKITVKCQTSTKGLITLSKYNGIKLSGDALKKTRFEIPFIGTNACLKGLDVGLISIELEVNARKEVIKYFPYYSVQ